MMKKKLEKDCRKWILFNNGLSDFQNLYEVYTAVESMKSKGGVSIEQNKNSENLELIVEQEGYESVLEINGAAERNRFLEYLQQHYFPDEEIEKWYATKTEEKNKNENHTITSGNKVNKNINFNVHSKEIRYYKWRAFFSIAIYLVVAVFIINSFLSSLSSGILTSLVIILVILFFAILRRIFQGFFIGLIKGASVKLNEQQYPEIYKIVKDQAKLLDINETPEVYILYGDFNAFVTNFARKRYLVLQSEVLETADRGNYEVVKFVVGHELGHIKRRHLNQEKWLTPSLLIPLLKQAHSRGCEFTCDRIGFQFSTRGAMEGILILAAGKEIYTKININQYLEDSIAEKSFWVWMSEKFLSHPHTSKRMIALKKYSERDV